MILKLYYQNKKYQATNKFHYGQLTELVFLTLLLNKKVTNL